MAHLSVLGYFIGSRSDYSIVFGTVHAGSLATQTLQFLT